MAAPMLVLLLGGLALPLLHFQNRTARSVYVEMVTLTASVLVGRLLYSPPEMADVFRMTSRFSIAFRLDGPGRLFAGLVAFLWPLATLYAFSYMAHEDRENAFFAWYTLSYAATLGIALAANLFTMYIFYECLTLATLPLVTHKRDVRSIHAGRLYLYCSLSGAALGFAGMMVLSFYGGAAPFVMGGNLTGIPARDEALLRALFVLSFIGFSVKAAMFPFYLWLPRASVAPTPVTALLHAVAVVNAGAFACMRLVYYCFGTDFLYGTAAQTAVLLLAAFTIVFGSAKAVREQHLKRRLAYSTVSNLSYILLGITLMTPEGLVGAMTHMISHGLIKITLFYCAGAVLIQTGQEYIQDIRGFGKVMPFTFSIFTLAGAALTGVPPLCGFLSKWNILTAAAGCGLKTGILGIGALIISAALTAVYILSVVTAVFFLPLSPGLETLQGERHDPSWLMKLPLLLISFAIVWMGLNGAAVTGWIRQSLFG